MELSLCICGKFQAYYAYNLFIKSIFIVSTTMQIFHAKVMCFASTYMRC